MTLLKKASAFKSLAFLLLISVVMLFSSSNASALVGSEFRAGRIIDDAIFFQPLTMGPNEIQNFLNGKVPVCDTWHSSSNPSYQPPFTCLKDYRQDTPYKAGESGLCNGFSTGNKSAALIIYEVGISCNVNPQVLLVLLQKEQSLVTDTWPWSIQYRSATGYGCPDTAPCDAEYYGFFNQVYNAARQFKRYARDSGSFNYRAGRDNYIQYNPNAACGGSNVYIQNVATAGLYNYTPYQPNASALNNLYGSGDGCGAYGNRNFWRMFNDWFGSSIVGFSPSPVYKGTNGTQLFAVWGGTKYYIPTYDTMIAWGLHTRPVNIVPDEYLAGLQTGDTLSNIAKASDDPNSPLYLFDDGKRYPIPFSACARDLGGGTNPGSTWKLDCFNTAVSKSYPSAFINSYSAQDITLPNMIAFGESVWKIEDGKKRRIIDGLIVDVLGGWGNVRWMKDSNATQPQGKLVMRNDYTIRFSDSGQVYLFDGEKLNPVPGLNEFYAWGLDKLPLNTVPASWNSSDPLPVTPSGLAITATDSSGNTFLVDKGYKLRLNSQWPSGTPTTTAPYALARLKEIPLSDTQLSDAGEIFTVYGNKRYVFATMDDFFQLGFRTETIRRVSTPAANISGLTYGGLHLANNRLFKISGSPEVYIVQGGTRKYVGSPYYPLAWDKMITVDSTTAARYPFSGTYTP